MLLTVIMLASFWPSCVHAEKFWRLLLVWLSEAALDQGWRSLILGPRLDQLLAALRPGSLVILSLGLPDSYPLQSVSREHRAVLLQISVFVSEDRRRLTRLYQALPRP